jgi:hypothetical protein
VGLGAVEWVEAIVLNGSERAMGETASGVQERLSRRSFLRAAGVCAAGFGGLRFLAERPELIARAASGDASASPFGPVVADPAGVLDLPRGFSYRVISRAGDEMDDGLLVPALADGMAAFPHPDGSGKCVLVRNHEVESAPAELGPWGASYERFPRVASSSVYDAGHGKTPAQGGTTNIVYDPAAGEVEAEFLSLAGTVRNCAGGPTPWGSWLSCEEDVTLPDERHAARHGYVFEVPASAEPGLAAPEPIREMGRFNHEAVAVDPATSIVYLTEDRDDGLLYRFVPRVKGDMHGGGRLQALTVIGSPRRDLRNWGDGERVRAGEAFNVAWVDLDGVDPDTDDLRHRGFSERGAARFARLEGIAWADGEAYAVCTSGGRMRKGQVFRYVPSRYEGTERESEAPARLELFVEPNDAALMDMPDNCCVSPRGDLIVCEDNGRATTRLIGVTSAGVPYVLARNAKSASEFAGVCFSPDGSTMFVNMQYDGLTFAVRGPWTG